MPKTQIHASVEDETISKINALATDQRRKFSEMVSIMLQDSPLLLNTIFKRHTDGTHTVVKKK